MYTAPNNKRYVGQTIRLHKRKQQHVADAYNPNSVSYNYAFHRAIRKYGIENFVFEILEDGIPREKLNEREMYWIEQMQSYGENGYNMTMGGDGVLGRVWTDEQRKKDSESHKGKRIGHPVSEETRRKIGEKNKGKSHPRSEETKRKISEHNARAVAKRITFSNAGVYRGKEFYPGLMFDSVTKCADYFGVKLSTMSSIKSGKFNKQSNMRIIEVTQ